MVTASFFTVFIAGILSFLSPCILPLLPGYISFISGEALTNLKNTNTVTPRLKAFLGALFFGFGFTLVFVILGATATGIGKLFVQHQTLFARIAGVLIFIFGLHMVGIFRINMLLKQVKINRKKGTAPFYIEAFILGVAFVLGWTPCVGPVLAGVLGIASQEQSVNQGMLLLFIYSLGLWIPFLISALAINEALVLVKKASKYLVWGERAAGVLIMVIGVALITDSMTKITVYLLKLAN